MREVRWDESTIEDDAVLRPIGQRDTEAELIGQGNHPFNPSGVAEDVVLLELDEDVLLPEPLDVLPKQRLRRSQLVGVDQVCQLSVAAPGQQDQPFGVVAELWR